MPIFNSGHPIANLETLDVSIDEKLGAFWVMMKKSGPQNFSKQMLFDISASQSFIANEYMSRKHYLENSGGDVTQIRFWVFGSRLSGLFNLGGDLEFFYETIIDRRWDELSYYAHKCVDVSYNAATGMGLPIISVAFVQGDALGGGFEAALSHGFIIAEKRARFGLPEVMFNMFPGMGAYNLLSYRTNRHQAENIILSGRVYTAQEMYDLGVVDVLLEDDSGDDDVSRFLAELGKKHNALSAIKSVRLETEPMGLGAMRRIADIWVDSAKTLKDGDLKKMSRLIAAQKRRRKKVIG